MADVIYHDRPRVPAGRRAVHWILGCILAGAVLTGATALFSRMELDINRQSISSLRQQVVEAAVQCYAIEGHYPDRISYLEQNYGIRYDASRYIVSLDLRSEDELPSVDVVRR